MFDQSFRKICFWLYTAWKSFWTCSNSGLCGLCGKVGGSFHIRGVGQVSRTNDDSVFADIISSMACSVDFGCRDIRKGLAFLCSASVRGQTNAKTPCCSYWDLQKVMRC